MDNLKEIDEGVFIYNSLDARLGSGTFGAVFRGLVRFPNTPDTPVALKIFNNRAHREKELEADLMSRANHPNIVKVIKTGYSNQYGFYIAMELCDCTLKGFLARQGIKKFSEQEACAFFKDICLGTKYLQDIGILHRDLKLENIMVDSNLHIKIGDFGLAKMVDGDLTTTTCGSTHIMAPEIIKKLPYGKESDVWSLGVLLYGMLTGEECLFRNVGRVEYENRVKNFMGVVFPSHTELSDEVKNLIFSILVVDPRARPTIDQILEHPWVKNNIADDDLMNSRYVLKTYIENGEAIKRISSILKNFLDFEISHKLLSKANESLGQMTKIASELETNAPKYATKEQIEFLTARVLQIAEVIVEKQQPPKKKGISMLKIFTTKRSKATVDLINSLKARTTHASPITNLSAKILEASYIEKLIEWVKSSKFFAENEGLSAVSNEDVQRELKFLKLAAMLGKVDPAELDISVFVSKKGIHGFASKFQLDEELLESHVYRVLDEYVFTELDESALLNEETIHAAEPGRELLEVFFSPYSALPERTAKFLDFLLGKLEDHTS